MFTRRDRCKNALAYLAMGLAFAATTSTAVAQACAVDCLRVYSIALQDQDTSNNGTVELTDETGGGARSTVVNGAWTRPDGSTFDQDANIGTCLRAEFRLNRSRP